MCAAALAVGAALGVVPSQGVRGGEGGWGKDQKGRGSRGATCALACAPLAPHLFPPTTPPAPLLSLFFSQDVATYAASCEKYVGTESGGMDQAISIMGQPGTAKLVSFNPVGVADVALPADAVFVVANSLAVSKKAETADVHYNLRVVECRVAAAALGRALLGGDEADPAQVTALKTLRAVEPLIEASPHGAGVAGKLAAVAAVLRKGVYDKAAVEAAVGMPLSTLLADAPAQARAAEVAFGRPDVAGLRLRDRAAHVYAEAERVHAFRAAAADDGGGLEGLGRLMDDSQASCRCVLFFSLFGRGVSRGGRALLPFSSLSLTYPCLLSTPLSPLSSPLPSDLYDCSCAELDELVGAAKAAGALGARLTGAGWGGCTVSLVRAGTEAAFIDALKAAFYASRVAAGVVQEEDLGATVFATRPAAGGAVLRL